MSTRAKQDGAMPRTAEDLVRRYRFEEKFTTKELVTERIRLKGATFSSTEMDLHEEGYYGSIRAELPKEVHDPVKVILAHTRGGGITLTVTRGEAQGAPGYTRLLMESMFSQRKLDMGTVLERSYITGLTPPLYPQDAANKEYVDACILQGSEDPLPEYWKEHIREKAAIIKALQDEGGKDCFSYVVMTDMHYPSNLGKKAPQIAKEIMDACGIKYALILGDVRTRGCHGTKEAAQTEWGNIEEMLAPLHGRILMTQGNHDAGYGRGDYDGDGDDDAFAYEFTPAEMFNRVYRKAGMAGNAVYDASGTAFYVDDAANKVRYILLNTQLNFNGNAGYSSYETVDGMAKYPSMWRFRYTQCQYDFLTTDALATVPNDDWGVVIGSHVPINNSGEMPEYPVMVGVLEAFNSKGKYTGEFAGTAVGDSVENFTNMADPTDESFRDNYQWSKDAEVAEDGWCISNYVPAQCANKNADIIRVKGLDPTAQTVMMAFDASYSRIALTSTSTYSDITFDEDGVATWKAGYVNNYISTSPANNLRYIRVSGKKMANAENVIITVNEEITYTESGAGYDAVSVDCDFTNAKGSLICYNAGHVHEDRASKTCYPNVPLTFPIITTRCDAAEENDEAFKAERIAGTVTEQSFDVLTVNKKTRAIYRTKIGAGSDGTISY